MSGARRFQSGVAAMERNIVHLGPLTMVVGMSEFDDWLGSCAVGDECTYAHGPALPAENAVCKRAYDLAMSGVLLLFQKPAPRGKYYHARRLKASGAESALEAAADEIAGADNLHREKQVAGTDAGRVLDILKRAANFNRQVPSLADLAQLAGLKDRQRARYLKDVLVDKGLIEITRKQGCVQVVTIVSSGKSTRGGV